MKVRCSSPKKVGGAYAVEGAKCGAVYLKIVENENNPTDLDLRTTHKRCPVCGGNETEPLTDYVLRDSTTVVVKNKEI